MFSLFPETFVVTLDLLRLIDETLLNWTDLIEMLYKMELNCKHNHNHSITKLIDHAQLHVKIA